MPHEGRRLLLALLLRSLLALLLCSFLGHLRFLLTEPDVQPSCRRNRAYKSQAETNRTTPNVFSGRSTMTSRRRVPAEAMVVNETDEESRQLLIYIESPQGLARFMRSS
jgi:hypothetical protein